MATDYDALAVELENAPPFVFDLQGEHFELRSMTSMEWHDQLALAEADPRASLQLIMGDDWPRMEALRFPAGVFEQIVTDWLDWQGVAPGESPAS